jgi:hypothetical protein
MPRRLIPAALVLLALVLGAPAFGAGPGPAGSQGGDGLVAGGLRYTALPGNGSTVVAAVETRTGRVRQSRAIEGNWGVPTLTVLGAPGGLSADGSALILVDMASSSQPLRRESTFLVLDRQNLQLRRFVRLRGDFTFDALSPDARYLFLIQRVSANDTSRYVVRAYDLVRSTLLPQAIADKAQRGWVMAGYPVKRLVGPGGRWVYTLYQQVGGYPFIHALDTMHRVAHCIGVPWHGDQSGLARLRLSLRDGGTTLALDRRDGTRFLAVNTATFAVSQPQAGSGSDTSWWIVVVVGVATTGIVAAVALRRPIARNAQRFRRRGPLPVQPS